MANKSIGQFIAALRKANGMTQQEVADRLNVSNKAVSRWERDECAPDISLIPALAEMFGVTCDELLKGERITGTYQTEKSEPKVEKQLRSLINRTISGFRTMIWVSLTLSFVGLICMFGISYGFFRPVIGFSVMLLFVALSLSVAAVATNKMKETKNENELFESADASQIQRFDKILGTLSFCAAFIAFSAIMLSLPLVIFTDSYSVLTAESYLGTFFLPVALILVWLCLTVKEAWISWVTGQPCAARDERSCAIVRRMTFWQLGAVALAAVLFVVAPSFEMPAQISPVVFAIETAGLAALVCSIICFAAFMAKYSDERKQLVLPGIRNLLMMVPAFFLTEFHDVGFYGFFNEFVEEFADEFKEPDYYKRYEMWNYEYLFYAVTLAVVIALVFKIINIIIKRNAKNISDVTDET